MAGVKALRKIQFGAENPAGTHVPATTLWRGTGVLADNREREFPEEDIGILMGDTRSYSPKLEGGIEFEEIEATYEQLPYLLEAGVESETPTQDGVGGYIRTYNFPTTSQRTPRFYTIEGGDNEEVERMEYSFVNEFTISGEKGAAVMMQSNWIGRQVQVKVDGFTADVPIPTVEEILFGTGQIYIDPVTTFPATTRLTGTWLGFELSVTTGFKAVYVADNLYFTFVKQIMPEVELQITFEHETFSKAEKAAWRAGTPRSVKLMFEGNNLDTAGTTYTKKTFIANLLGVWHPFDPLDDDDGNNVMAGTLTCRYNATAASAGQFIVVNDLATLP